MTCLGHKISENNAVFKTTISIVRQRFTTFNEASNYLATKTCRFFTKLAMAAKGAVSIQ